ncbi:Multifunctional pyrimidine synthesis protein CAD, partial [Ceratobasidium sp. 394]
MSLFLRSRIASKSLAGLTRQYASHASNGVLPAILHLKTGQSFSGHSFGAPKSIFGETVFSTSITS